jgi:hypothetical protein
VVHVLSRQAVRGVVAVAPGAVDGQPAGDGLAVRVRERGHGADLDHARVVVPRQVVVAEQQRLQQPAAAAAARAVELVRRELRRLRSRGQRRQARGDEAAVAERGGAAAVLVVRVEHRLRRLLAGEVVEHLLHPLHLVQERVVLVDQRRGRARGRRHGRRQRERVARVVEERRREAAAGVGIAVGVGERVHVLRAQQRDLPLDVRRVEREARALPALEARVPVVLDLVVRPPGQLRGAKNKRS